MTSDFQLSELNPNRNEVKLNLCEWLPRFVCSINSVSMTCDPNARKGDILKFSIGFKYHIYISTKLCNEKIGKLEMQAMNHSNLFFEKKWWHSSSTLNPKVQISFLWAIYTWIMSYIFNYINLEEYEDYVVESVIYVSVILHIKC